MTRWFVGCTLLGIFGTFIGETPAQLRPEKEDAHAAAFGKLGGSDLLGIYKKR